MMSNFREGKGSKLTLKMGSFFNALLCQLCPANERGEFLLRFVDFFCTVYFKKQAQNICLFLCRSYDIIKEHFVFILHLGFAQ